LRKIFHFDRPITNINKGDCIVSKIDLKQIFATLVSAFYVLANVRHIAERTQL